MTAQQSGEWLGGLLMRKPVIAVLPLVLVHPTNPCIQQYIP